MQKVLIYTFFIFTDYRLTFINKSCYRYRFDVNLSNIPNYFSFGHILANSYRGGPFHLPYFGVWRRDALPTEKESASSTLSTLETPFSTQTSQPLKNQ